MKQWILKIEALFRSVFKGKITGLSTKEMESWLELGGSFVLILLLSLAVGKGFFGLFYALCFLFLRSIFSRELSIKRGIRILITVLIYAACLIFNQLITSNWIYLVMGLAGAFFIYQYPSGKKADKTRTLTMDFVFVCLIISFGGFLILGYAVPAVNLALFSAGLWRLAVFYTTG